MDNTKLRKYSQESHEKWIKSSPVFKEKTLLIRSYQVMQRWEDNYMKSLAAVATSGGGDILEVGFGLGISALYIQKSKKIKSHTIIECHPGIISFAKKFFQRQLKSGKIKLLEGFWEDLIPVIPDQSFDGILFDTCSLDSPVEFFQFFPFFQEAYRLLKNKGIFTYFSDEVKEISENHRKELELAGFKNISFKICKVHPPKTCEYWKHNTIVVPVIMKNLKI